MREYFGQFFPKQRERLSFSQKLRDDLGMPGQYTRSRLLRGIYVEAGQALLDLARWEEAITVFEQALKEDPTQKSVPDWEIYTFMAAAFQEIGDAQAAFHTYLVAVQQAPQQAYILLERAHQLLTTAIVRAERAWLLKEWITVCTTPELDAKQLASINLFLGRTYLHLKKYSSAVSEFEQALRGLPNDTRVLEGLGQALWRSGETGRAISVLRQAYNLAKQEKQTERLVPIHAKLVQALAADGQFKAALSEIPSTLSTNTPFGYKLLVTSSLCHLALQEPQEALEAAQLATQRRSTCESYLLSAQAFIALKQHVNALEATNQALQLDPANTDTLFYQAQARIEGHLDLRQGCRLLENYREDNGEEAIRRYLQTPSLVARQDDASMHYFLAQLHFTFQDYQEAEQQLNYAFALEFIDANSQLEAPAQMLKGELLLKISPTTPEKTELAATCFYEAGVLFYDLASTYTSSVQIEAANVDAENALRQAIELKPDHALSHLYLAATLMALATQQNVLTNEEKLKQALKSWQHSADIGMPSTFLEWSFFIRALCLHALALTKQAQFDEATSLNWEATYWVERALLITLENNANALTFLGYCYMWLGRSVTTLETLPEVLNSVDLIMVKTLVLILLEDENADEAVENCRQHIQDAYIELLYAYLLYANKKFPDTIQPLDNSIEIDHTSLSSWCMRGHIYRLLGKESQSQADFKHVWEATTPGQPLAIPENMQDRADAAYELRYYSEAIDVLKESLKNPKTYLSEIYVTLAFNFLALRRLDEAKQALQNTLDHLSDIVMSLFIHYSLQDLADFEQFHLGEYANTTPVQEIIAPYREALLKKYQQIREQAGRDRGATRELIQPLEQGDYQAGTHAWFASYAGAARIALRTQQLEEAVNYYQILLQYDNDHNTQHFPEARLGLARALTALGVKKTSDCQLDEAVILLLGSIHYYSEDQQVSAVQAMLQEATPLISSLKHYQAFTEVLRLLGNDPLLDVQQRRELILAQLNLSEEQVQTYHLMHSALSQEDMNKIVSREKIVLELGSDLIDERLISEQVIDVDIPAMRDRIRQSTGLSIPGIRMRENNELLNNEYQVLFFNGLHYRRIIAPSSSPHSMLDAYTTILSNVEELLLEHLDILLSMQEVQFMVEVWKQEGREERRMLLKEALPDDLAVAHLAQVLRALVKEQLPIVDLERILIAFNSMKERTIVDIISHVCTVLRQAQTEHAEHSH